MIKEITQRHSVFVAVALACLVLAGCGGVYDASVHGVVMLDGNPIHRGTVSYSPTNGGPPAYGRIDGDGSYYLRTGREEGIPSGQYSVTVVANEPPKEKRTRSGGPPPAGKPITPPWYRSKKTSGLKFAVDSGSNEINLELTSEPPPSWKPKKRRRRR